MRRHAKRIAIFVVGWALIVAGIAGLALPILPGWVFIFLGLALLAREFEWAERRQHQLKTAYQAKKQQVLRHHRERVDQRHAADAVEAAGDAGDFVDESLIEPEPAQLRAPHDR
jgi:uncharacterized protein (TIGR02611 family)